MRKLFTMSFAAAALLLGSCAQNEVIESPSEQKTIGFTTLNDRVTANTRAANDAESDYGVFAVWENNSSKWFMNNLKVYGKTEGDNTVDTYSPTYYWPHEGGVSFYAYAPYNEETVADRFEFLNNETPSATDKLSITYTVPKEAQEDFTVATPMKTQTSASNSNNVPFSFSHMLSKITVDAVLDTDLIEAGYSIDVTGAGTVEDPLVPTFTTTLDVAKNTGTVDLTAEAPAFAVPTEGSSASYIGKKSYMIMPQTSTGVKLQLNGVKIMHNGELYWGGKSDSNMATYTIATGNVADNTFAAGKHYKITFTIGAKAIDGSDKPVFGEAITFSSEVADWTDVNAGVDQPKGN